MKTSGIADRAVLALVLVFSALLLAPALEGGFLTDDFQVFGKLGERVVHEDGFSLANLEALAYYYTHEADARFQLYRPTHVATFGLTLLAGGAVPLPYLATNLALHLLGGALLWLLMRALLPESATIVRSIAVLWFLTSPLQMETVNWVSARSESLSLVFGLGALLAKVSEPRRILLPAVLAGLSLTCKESSLVFFAAIGAIDLFRPAAEGSSLGARLATALLRNLPAMLLVAGYFLLRKHLFGEFFRVRYNNEQLGEIVASGEVWPRLGWSTWRLLVPVGEDVVGSSPQRLVVAVLLAPTLPVVVGFGLRRVPGRALLPAAVAVILVLLPFLFGVPMNMITPKLVNARAVYTPIAGLAILLASALDRSRARALVFAAAALLLATGILQARGSIARYVEAGQAMERSLESVRAPLRELGTNRLGRVLLLNYPFPDQTYFGGSFEMGGGLHPALSYPFVPMRLYVATTSANFTAPKGQTPFASVIDADGADLAIFHMTTDAHGVALGRILARGLYAPDARRALSAIAPPRGFTLVADPAAPASTAQTFRVRAAGFEAKLLRFTLFGATGVVGEIAADTRDLPTVEDEVRGTRDYDITLPAAPPELLSQLQEKTPFGWTVAAVDDQGRTVAQTEPRALWVEPKR